MLITVPAGPETRSWAQPARFWPMSKSHTPGWVWRIETGLIVSVTLMAGAIWACSVPLGPSTTVGTAQEESSKVAVSQPGISRRAS